MTSGDYYMMGYRHATYIGSRDMSLWRSVPSYRVGFRHGKQDGGNSLMKELRRRQWADSPPAAMKQTARRQAVLFD